jgi:hypothetical protein
MLVKLYIKSASTSVFTRSLGVKMQKAVCGDVFVGLTTRK